ncbi:MAG: AMP-binding protein [Eubacteriaceae bacterium]|jgi:acetyl-CoA synthetase|nr:AMP-binding protein [Eubacteriaceae bacterium]
MDLLYKKYAREELDSSGRLCRLTFEAPDSYNFAYDCVDDIAARSPEKSALVWLSGDQSEEKTFTFADMRDESMRAASFFASLGIKKGDAVMLILKRHYTFWHAVIGLHRIGAVAVPATNQLLEHDLAYRFNKAKIAAVVCTSDGFVKEECEKAFASSPTVRTKILVGEERAGWESWHSGLSSQPADFPRPTGEKATRRDEAMLMYFTSGTTGYPRLAVHAHTYSLGHIFTGRYWHNADPDGLHFTISDTGWGKAVWGKLYGQWLSETAVFAYDFERFDADTILRLFSRFRITTFCAPPTMYRFFIKEDLSKYDLSSLKYACTAGEALNPEVFNRFKEYTGLSIMEGFGQTETTLTVANMVGDIPRPGSMGRPNPQYRLRLVDSDRQDVETGETGEIVIDLSEGRPYGLFLGYVGDDEANAAAVADGLYHTGDTAWSDEDGYLYYVGRTDDLIKSSGYRISPFEVESVIMELPYVLECAVIGLADDLRGQLVTAVIVPVKGTDATDELKKEVQNYVKASTAPYKYPRRVEFVSELPKTISGKIKKAELRKAYNAQ